MYWSTQKLKEMQYNTRNISNNVCEQIWDSHFHSLHQSNSIGLMLPKINRKTEKFCVLNILLCKLLILKMFENFEMFFEYL